MTGPIATLSSFSSIQESSAPGKNWGHPYAFRFLPTGTSACGARRVSTSTRVPSFWVCHFIVEPRRQGVKRDCPPGGRRPGRAQIFWQTAPPPTNARGSRSVRLNAGPRARSAPLGRGRTCLGSSPHGASSPDAQRRCGHSRGAKRSPSGRAQHPYCWWLQCEKLPPPRRTAALHTRAAGSGSVRSFLCPSGGIGRVPEKSVTSASLGA